MKHTEDFRYSVPIVKAEEGPEGDWVFEAYASIPGRDLQGEDIDPQGLDIDFFLGKDQPKGGGGYIGYDHKPGIMVGYPIEGKITPKGFWLKWKALKTPFMRRIVDQMKALKEAGWPRRYGMSIEGAVKERDPFDPTKILSAFVKNVDLTPTPVKPGTWVDFAKSLSGRTVITYDPDWPLKEAVRAWAETSVAIAKGLVPLGENPYFLASGRLRKGADLEYFEDVLGLEGRDALEASRFALLRQDDVVKSVFPPPLRERLARWKRSRPGDRHILPDGTPREGVRSLAEHLLACEGLSPDQTVAVIRSVYRPVGRRSA